MSPATEALPSYLKKHISKQAYDSYTSQDHAAWRYIMRQNAAFFSRHAVPVYLEGLAKTGIRLDRIPRVTEMDDCLAQFGWGAVAVEGFIPPAAFLDFQARSVLPIACDMRTVDHIAYTPAPDIVHEAAGHAPILADAPYARYLHRYAAMAQKAIFSEDDVRLYEAIRYLSDIKENPDTKPEEIALAELRLREVTRSIPNPSEAARVARMNWWTVEYGLVGDINHPRIYGAGLLSSVGESQACLSDRVRKIPLSVDCVDTSYDITEPQPQLFVARDMEQLVEVLQDFEKSLSYVRGGLHALLEAQRARTVTTTSLDSGLQISGVLTDFIQDGKSTSFIKYGGPVQLSYEWQQLKNHGKDRHPTGFSSPIHRWEGVSKPLHSLSDTDLNKLGIEHGRTTTLNLESGFKVRGKILGWTRQQGSLLLITWGDCQVTRGDEVFFRPAWGEFDMAIGEKIDAITGGPADRESYGEFNVGKPSSSPGRKSPFSKEELRLFEAYSELRRLRDTGSGDLGAFAESVIKNHPGEWLLNLELLELGKSVKQPWVDSVEKNLHRVADSSDETKKDLIRKGMELSSVS